MNCIKIMLCCFLCKKYLATKPFDLHALHLFHLVAKHRSFTRAAREAGLSQSALTRQMQSLESRLGLDLINRTPRGRSEVTEAGLYLAAEAARLIGGVTATLDGLHAAFGSARPEVRVSVSRTLAMAHMPGLFHANHQRHPEVACRVSYHAGQLDSDRFGRERDGHWRALPAPRSCRIL